jgi:tetratricopeptide (TPR) repeat protein
LEDRLDHAIKRETNMLWKGLSAAVVIIFTSDVFAATAPLLEMVPKNLGYCGSMYAAPYASFKDGKKPRICEPPTPRKYTPARSNIGVEALDIESEACFVPDTAYQLLDRIIDLVKAKAGPVAPPQDDRGRIAFALNIGRITGEVLAELGFGLYIPTDTLGDALVPKNEIGEPARHIIDCDTGSLILLSVAHTLGIDASLVEITLPSGSGHNFARWQIGGQTIDWDTNGRAQCVMPLNNPKFQGRSMTHEETIAYILVLRAARRSRNGETVKALDDYRLAIEKFPEHPSAYNNFIWNVATKSFVDRDKAKVEALGYVETLLNIQRSANNLDTVACIFALDDQFKKAAEYEAKALRYDPTNEDFLARLMQFSADIPKDCTGAH